MITLKDLYNVLGAIIPLYVTMFLAYASLKWWKIFTPEQCSGINRFVATFAIPLLSFQFISQINPFKMNFLFIAADALSKSLVLFLLFFFSVFSQMVNLDWTITLFSLSTLPNTLVMGIPLLKSMYGNDQQGLMIQVVVLQSIIWYTLLLFLFEYREARNSVMVSRVAKTDVVHVVEIEQQRVLTGNRVVPDTEKGNVVEEEGEEKNGEELHKFVWRCWCCNSQGN